MAPRREILVLVEEEDRAGELVRPARGSGSKLRVREWGQVTRADLERRGLRAVVFEPSPDHPQRRRREILRSVPGDVPRIALVPEGRPHAARDASAADWELAAPVDQRMLTRLVEAEQRCRELEEQLRRTRRVAGQTSRHLRLLGEIGQSSNLELQPRRIAETALGRIREICPVGAWSVLLVDEEKSCLVVVSSGGTGMDSLRGARLGMGEGLAGRVLRSRAPFLLTRAVSPSLPVPPEIPAGLAWRQILALPLVSRGKAIGVIELIQRESQRAFRPRDVRLLTLLVEPIAVAVENAVLLRRSEELSITDDLTKLYNSRYLNSHLLREVQRSRRYGGQVSLIFLDLDGFKCVNDQHGHLAGSRALVEVGAVIRHMVREIDVVSRFGGDEFTVILPQTGPAGARTIAERIRERVEQTVFLETFGLQVRITASFGIATFPDHADSKDTLIQKADQAMYRVKGRGKNGVEMSD